MSRITCTFFLILCVCACGLVGCGGKNTEVRTTTTGQELQDLDAARDKGLLTESEYKAKRKEIMSRK